MTYASWRIWTVMAAVVILRPVDGSGQAPGDTLPAPAVLVDRILAGDDGQQAWSSLVDALGVDSAAAAAALERGDSLPRAGVGGVSVVLGDHVPPLASVPARTAIGRSVAPRGRASFDGAGVPHSDAGDGRASQALGVLGLCLLASSFGLIAAALRRRGRPRGLRGRHRRSFMSRDAERLEARLRARGAV